MAIMATGLIVTVVSIIRLTYLYPREAPPQAASVSVQYQFTFWSMLELNIALICTSAPALKQFVGRTFPAVRVYATNLTSKASGRPGLASQLHNGHKGSFSSSKPSWSRKSPRWDPVSERGSGDDVMRGTSRSMDRRVKDGSYLELGPVNAVADPSRVYGPTTRVSASGKYLTGTR
jgi:hypothetical protein